MCKSNLFINRGMALFFQLNIFVTIATDDYVDGKEQASLVEVRAVFIECTDRQNDPDSEITRFQRQELFKHSALRDCNKKLALTVKLTSDPDLQIPQEKTAKNEQPSGDEYIPIDHVFEGPNRKRVRLLNPYILRLRREPPIQAYKLHRIDDINNDMEFQAVSGVLTKSDIPIHHKTEKDKGKNRLRKQRDVEHVADDWAPDAVFTLEHNELGRHGYSVRTTDERSSPSSFKWGGVSKDCAEKHCSKRSNSTPIRVQRHLQNVVIEGPVKHNKKYISYFGEQTRGEELDTFSTPHEDYDISPRSKGKARLHTNHFHRKKSQNENLLTNTRSSTTKYELGNNENNHNARKYSDNEEASPEKDFLLYEIGSPNVWYTVQVQLLEKLNTRNGKTVWNDLTDGAIASVSTTNPAWNGHNMHLRYRSAEYTPRDEYTLPQTSLCLLEPIHDANVSDSDNVDYAPDSEQFIVVPIEDVVGIEDKATNLNKRKRNIAESTSAETNTKRLPRRVEVRLSRAMIPDATDNFNIAYHGSDCFLTLPYRRTYRAQIDVEVKADDNQLVRVGSSGRLSTIVSDHTRISRAVLTVQAANTGLASAGFRTVIRDCGPELSGLVNKKTTEGSTAGPIHVPPQHTKKFLIDLPIEFPDEVAHCSVALVNDDDQTVAVRDVAIKKRDRCFCVWHCNCVCLSEDPKLICREMTESCQAAAGLIPPEHMRRTRSECYPDFMGLDIWASVCGTIIFLLTLGLVKAVIGLIFPRVGNWGLGLIIELPRVLDHYFEMELRDREVVYDDEGWPVHLNTNRRTVRVYSRSAGFLLNTILFVAVPCILMWGILKKIIGMCVSKKINTNKNSECQSTDFQNVTLVIRRQRRYALHKWMSQPADDLTGTIWEQGLSLKKAPSEVLVSHMQPLLHQDSVFKKEEEPPGPDSEQEDTLYVLKQMQKSRASLMAYTHSREEIEEDELGTFPSHQRVAEEPRKQNDSRGSKVSFARNTNNE